MQLIRLELRRLEFPTIIMTLEPAEEMLSFQYWKQTASSMWQSDIMQAIRI